MANVAIFGFGTCDLPHSGRLTCDKESTGGFQHFVFPSQKQSDATADTTQSSMSAFPMVCACKQNII